MVSFLLFSLAASAPAVLVGPSGIIATDVIKNVDTGMDVQAILVGPSGIIANGNFGSSGGEQIQSQFKQGQFDLARSKVKSSIVNSNCATPEDVKSALANSKRPALGSSGGEQTQSQFKQGQFDLARESNVKSSIANSNWATPEDVKSALANSNRPAVGSSGGEQSQSQFKQGQFDLARESHAKSSIANSNWPTPEDVKSALENSNRPALGSSGGEQTQSQFKQGQFDFARESNVKSSIVNSNWATPEDVKSALVNINRPTLGSSGGEQSQLAFEKEKMNRQFVSSQQQQGGIASCIESKGVGIDSNDNFLLVGPNNGLLIGTGGVLKNMACVDKSQEVKGFEKEKMNRQFVSSQQQQGGIASCIESKGVGIDSNDNFLLVGPNNGLLIGTGGVLKNMACVDKSQEVKGSSGGEQSQLAFEKEKMNRQFVSSQQQQGGIASCIESKGVGIDSNDNFLLVGPNNGLLIGTGGVLKNMACVDKSQEVKDMIRDKSVKQDIVRRHYYGYGDYWNYWNTCH
jgi:mRNA-degrading endonuclease HigB of HigAB toxin-antitoxin module